MPHYLALFLLFFGAGLSPLQANPLTAMSLVALNGKRLPPAQLQNKVVLVVNVASRCGFTSQYAGLQKLYETYKARGLVIVGVPCNQFGWQEPGDEKEIQAFCQSKYGVTFPVLKKQKVRGDEKTKLYEFLVKSPVGEDSEVRWNFEKFLVDRNGKVSARFRSVTEPGDPELISSIEKALGPPMEKPAPKAPIPGPSGGPKPQ